MISQTDLKTLIPAFVAPCVLLYESISGNHISESSQTALTNGIFIGVGFVVSMWGIYKNHQKKPPDVITAVTTAIEETKAMAQPPKPTAAPLLAPQSTPAETGDKSPIVTQEDLNKQLTL